MRDWLRDWWRGYSDADLSNMRHRAFVENQNIKNHIDTLRIEGDALRAAREAIRAEREGTQIIDEIFAVRVRNNIPWKRLMEIAMKHAPEETKAALRDINANDRAISDLMVELAK